ncbi:MAG: response regulator [Desulfobacterales bacterium]|nr:response regulator [Desulfobacterales bacterium]
MKAILCVDDEKFILDSLRALLTDYFGDEYLCEIAESAEDAFEVIKELKEEGSEVIIIISDWLMPGINGDEFLIRVHMQFPNIVKIMLTGQADEGAVNRVKQEANLYKCLRKPWEEEDLIETIKTALNNSDV